MMNVILETLAQISEFVGVILEIPGALLLDISNWLHYMATRGIENTNDDDINE